MIRVKLAITHGEYHAAIVENKFVIDLSLHPHRYQQIRKFKIDKSKNIKRVLFQFENGDVDK